MVFIPSLIIASTIALTSFTPGAGAAVIPMPMDHATQRPIMREDTRMDKRAPGLVVSPKYDVHHSQHWNYHHGYVNKDGHGHGPPHRRSENSARNYRKNGHKSHKPKAVAADIQVRSFKESKPSLEIKVLKRHDHDEHRHHGDHYDHYEHRHDHDKRDLEPRHDHDHDHYDHDRYDERYGHYDHNGRFHYDHHKVKRAEVEPRHDHDHYDHHGHYDEHYHHHHDKREDNVMLTKRSTVMVEPASAPAIAARDHRDEHYDHHRHHENHHHHARSEQEESSDLEARHKSEKGGKKGKGKGETKKEEASHHKGGKEHKGKGKGGKRSIFEKRSLAPAGVPGFVEVASPLFNSTLARSIAGLVFSANPDTSANASAFILGTSSSQSTQFYLSASPSTPLAAVTGALAGPNVVNIRIPILNSQALTTTDFCATFDLSPPSPLSLLPCGSIPGYSQDFAYNSTTSELQPLYAASAPAPMAMVDTTGGKMQTSKTPAKSFAAAASPATPAPEQEAPQAISLYFVPASAYYQPPVAVQALFASNNAATTTNSTSMPSNSTTSSTVASSGPPPAPMADGAMDGNTPDAQDSTMAAPAPAATASPAAASNNAPPAAAASSMPPMSMAASSPSPTVQTVTMTSTAVTTATATPAAAAPPAQMTTSTMASPAAATPLSTSTVGSSTMMVQGTTNAMKFAKW